MRNSFPAKWAIGMFEKRFNRMVEKGAAEPTEKKDHWTFFVKELKTDGTINEHQANGWFNPYG